MKTSKFCQSCAMPLFKGGKEINGSEKDGSKSEKYCQFCYQEGAFTDPDCSYEEMLAIGKKGIKEDSRNPIMKFFLNLSYGSLLKKMDRWQTDK